MKMSVLLSNPITRRGFIAAAASALAFPSSSSNVLAEERDSFGNTPQDFQALINENPEIGLTLRSYLQAHKYKDDPEKMRAAIVAYDVGLGQYARYLIKKRDMQAAGAKPAELDRMRLQWADETQKLMCNEKVLTSLLLNEMCHALADPTVRADAAYAQFSKAKSLLEGAAFGASIWARRHPSKKNETISYVLEGISFYFPDGKGIADNIRKGVSDEYLQRMFQMSHYAFEYLSAELAKNPSANAAVLANLLKDKRVQNQTSHVPGAAKQVDVKTLPPEMQEFVQFVLNNKNLKEKPNEQAAKIVEMFFKALEEKGKAAAEKLTQAENEQRGAEEKLIIAKREHDRTVSEVKAYAQLAGIILAEVLGKPDLARLVQFVANEGMSLYLETKRFQEDRTGKYGASIAASALTMNYVVFALSVFNMLSAMGGASFEQIVVEQFGKLRQDIFDLKKFVNDRFDRLEMINFAMLDRLETLFNVTRLGLFNTEIRLKEIQSQLAQLKKDESLDRRQEDRGDLVKDIEDFYQQMGVGDPRYSASDAFIQRIRTLKGHAVAYAKDTAANFASSAARETPTIHAAIEAAIEDVALRKDPEISTGAIGVILKFIGVSTEVTGVPNPAAWYDAVNAYTHMLASTIKHASGADDQAIRELYDQGNAAAKFIVNNITEENVAKAGQRYQQAVDNLTAKVADIFLKKIKEGTNLPKEGIAVPPYRFNGLFDHNQKHRENYGNSYELFEIAQAIGLMEVRFGENRDFSWTGIRQIQLVFKKGPGHWNGLTVGDLNYNTYTGGSIKHDIHSRFDIGEDYGTPINVTMPAHISRTPLPLSDNREPYAPNLTGQLRYVEYPRDFPPMFATRFGAVEGKYPILQPQDMGPTKELYRLVGEGIDVYLEDLQRNIARKISEGIDPDFDVSGEIAEVDAAATAFEMMNALLAYRQGGHRREGTWPRAMKGREYISLLGGLMHAKGEARLRFIEQVDPDEVNVKGFDVTAIPTRKVVLLDEKNPGWPDRIDNFIIKAFRRVVRENIAALTKPVSTSPVEGSFVQFDRGLAALRVMAKARNLTLHN
jgi:hypothetical protein